MRTAHSSGRRGVSVLVHAGICLPGEGCLPQCMLEYVCQEVSAPVHAGIHPLWTEWLIDRCKNITLPQLRCGQKK